MGLRFRRSVRLLPGVKLNLGQKSSSISIGVRGLHYTLGTRGARVTAGIPGTGLNWSQSISKSTSPANAIGTPNAPQSQMPRKKGILLPLVIVLAMLFLAYATSRDRSPSSAPPPMISQIVEQTSAAGSIALPQIFPGVSVPVVPPVQDIARQDETAMLFRVVPADTSPLPSPESVPLPRRRPKTLEQQPLQLHRQNP
jgi:hypothetical protein